MGEGYLPQMTASVSTFIPVDATHCVPSECHSHGYKQRNCHHLICFWEFGFGFVCVCALCQSRKHIYLSKVACKVTSGPRFARELLFLLLVFCDLRIEKETLPAAFTMSLYNLTLQKILNNVIWRKILFNCTMCTNTKRAGYVQNNMADNEQIIPEGIM